MASKKDKERRKLKLADAHKHAKQKEQDSDFSCVKLPNTCEWIKLPKEDNVKLKWDFMVWIAGKFNPDNEDGDEGFGVYKRVYGQHRIPGPDGRDKVVACRHRNWGERCAVCEYLVRNAGALDDELKKKMREKKRILWLVNDKPGKSPDGNKHKWKVYDSNTTAPGSSGFWERVQGAISMLEEDEIPFSPSDGYMALMLVTAQPAFEGGNPWWCVSQITLKKRDYSYPDDLAFKAPCLDECIIDPGYDEVLQLLTGGRKRKKGEEEEDEDTDNDEDEREEDEKPSRKRSQKEDIDGEEEEQEENADSSDLDDEDSSGDREESEFKVGDKVEHTEYGECIVHAVSEDGTSLTLKKGRKTHKGVDPEDCEIMEEEKKSPKSARGAGKSTKGTGKAKRASGTDDSDLDEDEDEDEDEPVGKTAKRVAASKAKSSKDDEEEEEDSDVEDSDVDSDVEDSPIEEDDSDLEEEKAPRTRKRGKK